MTEILILDYNRPLELFALLKSIKKCCQFEKKVVVLNNGGEHYADEHWGDGLIDEVIHNSINIGCGAGTVQLFSQCKSEYAFYVQVDHFLTATITQKSIDMMVSQIEDYDEVAYIDVAGDQGNGKYSERAQFINRDFYLTIPKTFFGPGPLDNDPWTEECVQNYLKENNLTFVTLNNSFGGPVFMDRGHSSVRSNPDGSEWKHCPDTKAVWCLKQPLERFKFPPLNEEEWELAISGKWPEEGLVIESWVDNSFEVWNKIEDRPAIPCKLRNEGEDRD